MRPYYSDILFVKSFTRRNGNVLKVAERLSLTVEKVMSIYRKLTTTRLDQYNNVVFQGVSLPTPINVSIKTGNKGKVNREVLAKLIADIKAANKDKSEAELQSMSILTA